MLRAGVSALLIALAGLSVSGVASAETLKVETRLEGVLVFPSSAEITRMGKVKLDKGSHTIILEDLPAQAIANSIRVEGRATGGLSIGSVDSRRRYLGQDESADLAPQRKALEDQIRRLEDDREVIQGEIDAANAQGELIRNLVGLPTRGMARQEGDSQPLKASDWTDFVALVGTGLRDVRETLVAAKVRQRAIQRQLAELRAKLGELAPKQRQITEVKVFVDAEVPLELDMIVKYQVGNASWSPLYDARLATGSKTEAPQLKMTRRAMVTQRTGEDWKDVAVSLSTTRPQSGSGAPELRPMVVDYKPKPRPKPAMVERRYRKQNDAMRDAEPAPMAEAVGGGLMSSMAPARPVQARIVNAPFQAIFEVPGRTTISSTGEAKRLQISQDIIQPKLSIRTVPKRTAKAYLYATLELGKGAPVLSGPVALFRDGVFVGNGKLPTLAGGEDHELGFGVDDLVRVRHSVSNEQRGETGLISSSRTDNRSYKISVKNLHERAISLTVIDQIPVAANEEIKVEVRGTKPTKMNFDDTRGVMAWESEIAPDEEKLINFGYVVSWPAAKDVVYRN